VAIYVTAVVVGKLQTALGEKRHAEVDSISAADTDSGSAD